MWLLYSGTLESREIVDPMYGLHPHFACKMFFGGAEVLTSRLFEVVVACGKVCTVKFKQQISSYETSALCNKQARKYTFVNGRWFRIIQMIKLRLTGADIRLGCQPDSDCVSHHPVNWYQIDWNTDINP